MLGLGGELVGLRPAAVVPAGWHSDIYGRSQSAYGRVRLFIYLSPTSTHSGALYDPHGTT